VLCRSSPSRFDRHVAGLPRMAPNSGMRLDVANSSNRPWTTVAATMATSQSFVARLESTAVDAKISTGTGASAPSLGS
jgi:hypothetical protein